MRLDGLGQLSDLSDSRLHYRSHSCQERSLLPHIASSFAELKLGHTVVANFFPMVPVSPRSHFCWKLLSPEQ